jgi:hypothetical protein
MTPPRSPRHQSVFDRVYRDRAKKEIRRRELAIKLFENEARTYMPVTNNVRRQMNESSSLSSIGNWERRVEKAREQCKEGKICVECLKKADIGTGTYLMEAIIVRVFVAPWNLGYHPMLILSLCLL